MALIQANPWIDAANYGAGLGSTLQQAFLQMPIVRAQLAQQAAQMGLQQQQFQFDREQAKIRAEQESRRIGIEQQRTGIEQQRATDTSKYQTGELGLRTTEETNRAAYQQRSLQIQQQEAENAATLRKAQADKLAEDVRQSQMTRDLANSLALQHSTPVPMGYEGPPSPSMDTYRYQILGSDPSALARVMEQEIKSQAEKFSPIAPGYGTMDTRTGAVVSPPNPMDRLGASPGLYEAAFKLLSDPSMSTDPATSNTAWHVVQALNPAIGATNNIPQGGQGKPIFAKNPQTGQRIVSTDGGNTWHPAPTQ